MIGTATVSSGSASFSTTTLAQGAHSITASYSGDATDTASTSSALTQTVNVAAPAAPSNLTATLSGSSQINLAWTASSTSGVTYDVYESTTSGFTPSASTRIASGITTTTYSATGLSGSTTYYYRVSAVNAGGESADTNQASAATPGALSCSVSYSVSSQWPGGFGGVYSIKNTGTTPITDWILTFTWPGTQAVTQAWNATYSQTGANVKFTYESYNATISAGSTLSGMGFNGTWSGSNVAPTAFYVNGTLCH